MSKTATITAKLEPEAQVAFAKLAEDAERSVSDLACEVLSNHVKLFSPVERGSLVTIPVQVTAKSFGELQMLDKFTDTKRQKLCRASVEHFLNLNRNALVKIQKFLRVTPNVDELPNQRYAFYRWVKDSWK